MYLFYIFLWAYCVLAFSCRSCAEEISCITIIIIIIIIIIIKKKKKEEGKEEEKAHLAQQTL